MALVDADLTKAHRAQESATGFVLHEDARQQLPEPGSARGVDECVHGHTTRSTPARLPGHIHGKLGDPGVALARTIRRGGGEGEDSAFILDDHDRMNAV